MQASSKRRRPLTVGICFLVFAALAIAPAGAGAVPITFTFDQGRLELNGSSGLPTTLGVGTSTLTAEIAGDGSFTAQPAGFNFPAASDGAGNTVDLDAGDITGTFNAASGELFFESSGFIMRFQGPGYSCSTTGLFELEFHTDVSTVDPAPPQYTPYPGVRFNSGSNPPVNGAVAEGWDGLPPAAGSGPPGSDCASAMPTAQGGIWLSNGISQPYYEVAVTTSGVSGGSGTVTGPPDVFGDAFTCSGACSANYRPKEGVTLEANPASGSQVSWGGDCSGTAPTCNLNVNEPKSVTATFTGSPPQTPPAATLPQAPLAVTPPPPPAGAKKKCKRKKRSAAAAKKCRKRK